MFVTTSVVKNIDFSILLCTEYLNISIGTFCRIDTLVPAELSLLSDRGDTHTHTPLQCLLSPASCHSLLVPSLLSLDSVSPFVAQ